MTTNGELNPTSFDPDDYQPDRFALQVASLVIHRRANFLPHSGKTFAELIELAANYHKYGTLIAELNREPTPFDPDAEEVPTPAEVFIETSDLIGYTQRVPGPSIGRDIRHFRLAARSDAGLSRLGPTPKMARSLAVTDLIQHADLRWEVKHVEVSQSHRRRGIASMLYDRIEEVLDTKLWASAWLSAEAHQFWKQRHPRTVQWHVPMEHLSRLWLSPKQLLNINAVMEFKLRATVGDQLPN